MALTRALAEFIATTTLGDVPPDVLSRVKVHLLDALACGYVGTDLPWTRMVASMVADQGGASDASIFGATTRVAVSQAALVNGVMIGGYEANHSGHLTHSAATVTPAALAIAERDHRSGAELLIALAVGTEAGCRIGHAQTRAVEDERGFHNPGANGPFAAAAAAGRLLGLDGLRQTYALGIAGSRSGGLVEYAWDGSMTKRLHPGRVSQGGLESAELAGRGFTGPTSILEGSYGFFNAFSPDPRPERVTDALGDEWRLVETMVKPYPCHGTGQSVVAILCSLRAEQDIDPLLVTRVHIRTNDAGHMLKERFLDAVPTNHLAAQCSLPFTTAVAIVRDLEDPLQFDVSVLDDPEIRRIAELVTWEAVDDDGPLRVEVEVAAGDHLALGVGGPYSGSVQNPASFDDVRDKFHRYSRHQLAEHRRDRVVEMVERLEDLEDAGALARELAPAVR